MHSDVPLDYAMAHWSGAQTVIELEIQWAAQLVTCLDLRWGHVMAHWLGSQTVELSELLWAAQLALCLDVP
eukprot:m.316894 g.316894  ORF g.316894 m.316894 type:complete len:71 (-) comp27551_c0_seq2:71-283(-)